MKDSSTFVITIDGPVAAGKTTVARQLAGTLGFTLLDTGAIYRCVALDAQRTGTDWQDDQAISGLAEGLDLEFRLVGEVNQVFLFGTDVTDAIRQPDISSGASIVSAHPPVRAALLSLQRQFAESESVIVEGRDTGTIVFPQADLKIFLTADAETRARRRFLELQDRGLDVPLEQISSELQTRDQRDSNRAVAPLVAASDAVFIDSTPFTCDEVVDQIIDLFDTRSALDRP